VSPLRLVALMLLPSSAMEVAVAAPLIGSHATGMSMPPAAPPPGIAPDVPPRPEPAPPVVGPSPARAPEPPAGNELPPNPDAAPAGDTPPWAAPVPAEPLGGPPLSVPLEPLLPQDSVNQTKPMSTARDRFVFDIVLLAASASM